MKSSKGTFNAEVESDRIFIISKHFSGSYTKAHWGKDRFVFFNMGSALTIEQLRELADFIEQIQARDAAGSQS